MTQPETLKRSKPSWPGTGGSRPSGTLFDTSGRTGSPAFAIMLIEPVPDTDALERDMALEFMRWVERNYGLPRIEDLGRALVVDGLEKAHAQIAARVGYITILAETNHSLGVKITEHGRQVYRDVIAREALTA